MSTPEVPLLGQLDPAVFERLLREKYQPLDSAEDYARLREKCGLGPLIEGQIAVPPREIESKETPSNA